MSKTAGWCLYVVPTEEQMPENGWMEYDYWEPDARNDRRKSMRDSKRFKRTKGIRTVRKMRRRIAW